jgi:trehalose monomycolate/heme transporter
MMLFTRWGRNVTRFRWLVLAGTVALVIAGIAWGSGVFGSLASGGFIDPGSQSATAEAQITARLGNQSPDLVILYSSKTQTVRDTAFRDSVVSTADALARQPTVARVITYYGTGLPALVSRNSHATYVVVRLTASSVTGKDNAYNALRPVMNATGLTTQVGGNTAVDATADAMVKTDLGKGEKIAFPLVFVLLILVFGGLAAAVLPLLVGGVAILGALTAIRLITLATSVSTFAVNTIILLGLGMGIDYSLLLVSRFREELAADGGVRDAVARTVATAGRTVVVSALTVALSLATLLIFPEVFLRSMAFGGMAAVLVAMTASLTLLPVMLALLGHRVDALRVPLPRLRHRAAGPVAALPGDTTADRAEAGAWAAIARSVMRRPVLYVAGVLAIVAVLGLPFGGVHFAGTDARVLPVGTEARVVSEQIASDFPGATTAPVEALVEGASAGQLRELTASIRSVPGVAAATVTAKRRDSALVTVDYSGPSNSDRAYTVVRDIRALPVPAGVTVLVGGAPADDVDMLASLGSRLPAMAALIAAVTILLLFLAFGSVVLPVLSVALNMASITGAFGVVVWIFQDGHLSGLLGFTVTGSLQPNIVILILAVLFGLATDYQVFLLSRIREAWHETGDNAAAVATGLQRTGRIITAAALLLIVVAAGFSSGQIVIAKTIGIGMIAALIIDASLVRVLLTPALMRLLGRLNWWAPQPLARLRSRQDASRPLAVFAPLTAWLYSRHQ